MGAAITRATIGGLASVAGGGKFANGAVTGAFQYLATTRYQGPGNDWRNSFNQAETLLGDLLKPEFGLDMGTVAARPPVLPEGMTRGQFGELMKWGDNVEAGPWLEKLTTDADFAKGIIDNLQTGGITKDMLGQWSRWYGDNFANWRPTPSQSEQPVQFQYRSQGLEYLQNKMPSVGGGAAAPFVCPARSQCT